jgi:hypothetical protein
MQSLQDPLGGFHDTFLCYTITTLYFEQLALAHFDKNSRFIKCNADTSIDPPGTPMHIDKGNMEPRRCPDDYPPLFEEPVVGKLFLDKNQRFTVMDNPVLAA